MKQNQRLYLLTFLSLALLLGSAIPAMAQEPGDSLTGQAALGTAFSYQGYLTQNGVPLDGQDQCDLSFGLWDAAANGTQLAATRRLSRLTSTPVILRSNSPAAASLGPPPSTARPAGWRSKFAARPGAASTPSWAGKP